MGILKDIWNTIFDKSKKQKEFAKGGSIEDHKLNLVYKKESPNLKIGGYASGDAKPDKLKTCHYEEVNNFCKPNFTPNNNGVCGVPIPIGDYFFNPIKKEDDSIPNGDDFFVSNELISKEINMDFKDEKFIKKQMVKNVIGQKTLAKIKDYLFTYGSIDILTCEQKFKVKSLKNFIWHLRKEGVEIKTEKVELHNELGQKVEVINYRLISEK